MGVSHAFGSTNKRVATDGVLTCILRNLGIMNDLLNRPTRSEKWRTGPLDVSLTAKATNTIGTENNSMANIASNMSNNRFIQPYPPVSPLVLSCLINCTFVFFKPFPDLLVS